MFSAHAYELRKRGYTALLPLRGKAPDLPSWQVFNAAPPSDTDIHYWAQTRPNHGIGLAIGPDQVAVIDLDFNGDGNARRARDIADQTLGHSPVWSVGNPPKSKLFYRHAGNLAIEGRTFGRFEVYIRSGQVVLYGIHPTTHQPYTWPEASPLDTAVTDLPEMTQDALNAFMEAMGPLTGIEADSHTLRSTTSSSDRTHGWAARALRAISDAPTRDPRDVCVALVASAPDGSRHPTMTGCAIALAECGYSDVEIADALMPAYLDATLQGETGTRERGCMSAIHWARGEIGSDAATIAATMRPDLIAASWHRRWHRE
jgi:hypothetical protein